MDRFFILIDTIKKINLGSRLQRKLKDLIEKKGQKKGRYIQDFSKKEAVFVNKATRTSRGTSNTSNSNFNSGIPQCSDVSSSEEEDIEMDKGRRKVMLRIQTKKLKGKVVKRNIIKYLSVAEKVTLKL